MIALAVRDRLNMPIAIATCEKVEYRSGILREMERSFWDIREEKGKESTGTGGRSIKGTGKREVAKPNSVVPRRHRAGTRDRGDADKLRFKL